MTRKHAILSLKLLPKKLIRQAKVKYMVCSDQLQHLPIDLNSILIHIFN